MKNKILAILLLTVPVYCFFIPNGFSAEWKAGAASAVITPVEPMWTAGYGGRPDPASGKISEIYVKALAIQDPSGEKIVIVTSDLVGLPYELTNPVAVAVGKKWGITRQSILFNASHTHCGPEIRGWPVKTVFNNYIKDDYFAKIGPYREWLGGKFMEVINNALTKLSPANITFSTARPVPFAVSRRFPDGKGGVIYRSNPSSYYTEGPRDDISPVLKVAAPDGKIIAILFGYACHPITLNDNKYSGDYPGFAQETVERDYPGAVALFMQGCTGQLVPNARYQVEYAMGHGKALAGAVKRAVEGPQTVLSGPIKTAYKDVRLNFKPITKELLQSQLSSNESAVRSNASYLLEKIARGEKVGQPIPAPVQAISFGPELMIVGFPGEAVVEYSVKSKAEFSSKAKFVWASAYNNYILGTSSVGYLPTVNILREGGYEAHERSRSPSLPNQFSEDVEEIIMGGMRELVSNITQ